MQENSGVVTVMSESGQALGHVTLVDVPGHERLRHRLEQQLQDAAAIVFLVDATDITPSRVRACGHAIHLS
jgi:signal recognition particle receptor subunit beta